MKFSKIIALILVTLHFSAQASAQIFETALVRGKRFKPSLEKVELPNLVSTEGFDGKYFKIVVGKSNDAISFSESDEKLKLKAATTYYHLNLIRDFWVNEMHSENVKNMSKVIVRLEITNLFSDLGHYQHDSIDPHYNDALSIPAGEPMEGVDIPAWGNEIWFRPVKKIKTEDLPASGLDSTANPLTKYIGMLSEPVKQSSTSRMIQIALQKIFAPDSFRGNSFQTSMVRQAGTIAVAAILMEASKHSDKLFLEKYYYLDTAMIPEIIYHEFSHIALSDQLTLGLSTPMLEGMADYFATTFANNPHIASKIKKYSLSMPKNGKNKSNYNPIYETNMFANSDFVLSLLWSVRKTLPEVSDQLIFNARLGLKTGFSDIRHDLIQALLDSCNTVCLDPRADRMKLREVFESRGF
jgi:hypothetical protein